MKPVDLNSLIQASASLDSSLLGSFLEHYGIETKPGELVDLNSLTSVLRAAGAKVGDLGSFYVGYKVPQIGKEFDLLRFGDTSIINIELKSESTPKKIATQLQRNYYYLSFLALPIEAFAFESSSAKIYRLSDDKQLEESDAAALLAALTKQKVGNHVDPDTLFNPSDFLVSPFNSTDRFLADEYFLTHQQEEIRSKALSSIASAPGACFIGITGTAGGYIEITVPIAAAATVNPGNLGVIINPAANMGNVTVRRGHDAQTISPAGRPSVNRYYDITPTINTALNASLTFNYFDAELNSRNEALLSFWTSPDNTTWTAANFSNRNTATNFVQLTGINSLPKRWTLTDQQFATGVFDLLANNKTLKLWPNPVTDNNTIYIQLSANKRTAGSLSVIDLSGRIVSIQMINMERGINTIQLNNLKLAAGSYTVLLKAEDGSSSNIRFIKK